MRPVPVLSCMALLACGGSGHSAARLELALTEGTEIHAVPGRRTEVVLLVLGANGREVVLTLGAAPPFVSLSGTVLVIAPERADAPGSFDVEITATAGRESDAKTLRVVVERTNAIPELLSVAIQDVRGGGVVWLPDGAQCLSGLRVIGTLFEPGDEQDPARVEVELVRDGEPFTGVPTSTSEWLERRVPASGGSYMDYDHVIPGIELGQAYRLAVRGADPLGGATEWWQSSGTLTCTPFALPFWARGFQSFTDPLCTSRGVLYFDIDGVLPGPAEVDEWGLPTWATVSISGSTISITMDAPADIADYTRFPFLLRVRSGGFTSSNTYQLFKC